MEPVKIVQSILLLPVTVTLLAVLPLQADADPCRSLTVVYCTRCHKIDRICDSLGKKDEAAWKETMRLMGEYADIDQVTQDQILSCVDKMEKGESTVCKK
jgi:hypothetical protein